MKIQDAQQRGQRIITSLSNPHLKVDVLLSYVLGKGKEYLIAHSDEYISKTVYKKFENLIYRHLQGEPIEYLINNKEFYGLNFYVDKRVLIPRPETEFLVDKALELAKNFKDRKIVSFADIGTGSGNIAVSIAKNLPNSRVIALDISDLALEVAKKNIQRHKVGSQIQLIQSNLLREMKNQKVDIMISNLPYIGRQTNNYVSKEALEFEPEVALFGGNSGLGLYKKMFTELKKYSSFPAYLLGEMGFTQADDIISALNKYFEQPKYEIIKDLSGTDRYFLVDFIK